MQIQFDVPEHTARSLGFDGPSSSRTAQHMLALFLYEHGKLSLGKACELGCMSMWEFVDQARALGVDIQYPSDAASGDLDRLRKLAH
jgi:predicted HTH domain antitoxin